jgi:type IV secretion system protein TrbL
MKSLQRAALISAVLLFYSAGAAAQLTNQGLLDQVVSEFATRAKGWQSVVMNAAMWLFWTLGTISLVWTGGMMILRKADIGEFFAEFFRFIMFFGFFLWLLRNGPDFASSIIKSLQLLGEQAGGVSSVTPSSIVDIGFMIFKQSLANTSFWSPIDSIIGFFLSLGILLVLATVGVNMLLLFVSSWILMYAGVFFLGFGGSRWTSDMAINYYKSVLGISIQIFAMVLLVGIGVDLLSSFYAKMNKGTLNFEELGVMLVFCMTLLMLINKIPGLLSGVITGAGINHAGIGGFGAGAVAGAALGAAGMAAATAASAGAALGAVASSAGGGVSALMAAFSKAGESASSGTDAISTGGGSGGATGGGAESGTSTPLAEAAGFGGSDSKGSSDSKDDKEASDSKDKGSGQGAGGESSAGSTSKPFNGEHARSNDRAPGSTGPGLVSSAGSALGKAGRITADASMNLAKGIGQVAATKASSVRASVMDRIADTTGGRIAAAIRSQGSSSSGAGPTFEGNNLSSGVNAISEVEAFANRGHRPNSMD